MATKKAAVKKAAPKKKAAVKKKAADQSWRQPTKTHKPAAEPPQAWEAGIGIEHAADESE